MYIYITCKKNNYKNTQVSGKLEIQALHRIGLNTDLILLRNILDKVINYVSKEEIYKKTLLVEAREDINQKLMLGSLLLTGILTIIIIFLYRKLYNEYCYRKKMRKNKEVLIENLSHDLKTPLATLKVNFGLLKKGLVDETDIDRYYERLDKNIDQLNNIITDLYSISDINEGFINQKKHKLFVHHFLEGIYEQNKGVFEAQNKELSFINKGVIDENAKFRINEKAMNRAITNLLSNSLKFTHDGGRVSIGYKTGNGNAIISITDDGIGIHPKDLTAIFERFYQSDSNTMKSGKGIGLSIAKEIIEFHNGDITASSELNKFTCFRIILPLE